MNIGSRVHEHVVSPFKVFNDGQMCTLDVFNAKGPHSTIGMVGLFYC
jgi:hypothetical protein